MQGAKVRTGLDPDGLEECGDRSTIQGLVDARHPMDTAVPVSGVHPLGGRSDVGRSELIELRQALPTLHHLLQATKLIQGDDRVQLIHERRSQPSCPGDSEALEGLGRHNGHAARAGRNNLGETQGICVGIRLGAERSASIESAEACR